jgi:TatD DNase family protein
MLVDMHFHICNRYHNAETLQRTLADIQENQIIVAAQACDFPTYSSTLERIKGQEYIFPAFGVLPWYATEYVTKLDKVRSHFDEVGMLGEIGIDYRAMERIPESTPELQKQLIEVFLEEAEKQDKIINLHIRRASEDTLEILSAYDLKRVIFHAHSDSVESIREGVDRGYYFTLNPHLFKMVAKEVPSELLLSEVDTIPRKWRAPSAILTQLLEKVAGHRDCTFKELERTIHQNSLRIMEGIPQLTKFATLLASALD